MIAPPPAACMSGSTACEAKNWWRKFVAIRSSKYSGVTSRVWCRSSWAALLTSPVIGPKASRIRPIARLQRRDVLQVRLLEAHLPARAVEPLRQRPARLDRDVEKAHPRALGGEGLDDRGPDAGGAAGDHDGLVAQIGIAGSHDVTPC